MNQLGVDESLERVPPVGVIHDRETDAGWGVLTVVGATGA